MSVATAKEAIVRLLKNVIILPRNAAGPLTAATVFIGA